MQVGNGKVVVFHYRLTDTEGNLTETSQGGEPLQYLHGSGNIIAGLEAQLAGRAAGERFTATIPPEQAYGVRNPYPVQRIPIKHLITRGKLVPGMVVAVNTEAGPRQMTVVKVGKFNVDVDANHPLAGKTLVFQIEIVEVRDASVEEMEHRHAHGPGGHDHG